MRIIPLDKEYVFCFIEDKVCFKHPVSNYYLMLDDLSINLLISIKWVKWGYFFFDSLSKELDKLDESYTLENIISKSLQEIPIIKENKKKIELDNIEINANNFESILNEKYFIKELEHIFNENTKVHLKLMINLREFLIISNILYPTLVKFKKIK